MAETLLDLSKFTEADFKLFDEQVKASMERHGVPGVSVGIAYGDKEYVAGYGVTNLENPLPVTPDTLFQIGSTTKTMTATIVMRLVDQGKIDLDAPVRTYLPDLALKDPEAAEKVTVKNLITHTAGWIGDFFAETGLGDDALDLFVKRLVEAGQVTPPGKFWSYNNAAFSLAGRVVEAVTGKSYEESLKELLLDPLEMKNSFFFAHDVISYRVAIGHRKEGENVVVGRKWALPRSANPAGGVCTSVKDQLKYARFHMGDGKAPDGTQLLKPETLALMQTPTFPAGGDEEIGLSWFIYKVGDVRAVKHGGSTFGQQSAFIMVPDRQFALAITTNLDEGTMLNDEVTDWAFEHFFGAKNPEPEHVTFSGEELAAYKGKYDALLSDIDVVQKDEGLEGTFNYHTNGLFEVDPPPIPGIQFAFYGPDKIVTLNGPYKGLKGEFVRDSDGKVNWFRFGGRMATRQN